MSLSTGKKIIQPPGDKVISGIGFQVENFDPTKAISNIDHIISNIISPLLDPAKYICIEKIRSKKL
jgi:hypothetical protein